MMRFIQMSTIYSLIKITCSGMLFQVNPIIIIGVYMKVFFPLVILLMILIVGANQMCLLKRYLKQWVIFILILRLADKIYFKYRLIILDLFPMILRIQ